MPRRSQRGRARRDGDASTTVAGARKSRCGQAAAGTRRRDLASLMAATSVLLLGAATQHAAPPLPAFPSATGQGAASRGGRGGDVYHVTNLQDYNSQQDEPKIPGSLRHAIRSAEGPRTIVFDVGGAIELASPLKILKDRLTIAGQTAPGGITLWGYPVEISQCRDVVVRYLRIRPGDFHAAGFDKRPGRGNQDLPGSAANALQIGNGARRIIVDHLSTSWGMDETLSVSDSYAVTVQNCLIAESLHNSFHPKGNHGYGTLVRGTLAQKEGAKHGDGYTFFGNLWAHHRARNPSIAGQQRLDDGQTEAERGGADVNLINNVIYNWGERATHRSTGGLIRVNLVANCYVVGPDSQEACIFNNDNPGRTLLYRRGNLLDATRNGRFDPQPAGPDAFAGLPEAAMEQQAPFAFIECVESDATNAAEAFRNVIEQTGASIERDAADHRVIASVLEGRGTLIDSPESLRDNQGRLPGIDDLPTRRRPQRFDSDGDGMPDSFEEARQLDPLDANDAAQRQLSPLGYTNLEVYLNGLTGERSCASRQSSPSDLDH